MNAESLVLVRVSPLFDRVQRTLGRRLIAFGSAIALMGCSTLDQAAPVISTESAKTDAPNTQPGSRTDHVDQRTIKKPAAVDSDARQETVAEVDAPRVSLVEEVAPRIKLIVADLERQKLLYDVEELSDCSGIFHRVLSQLNNFYPKEEQPDIKQYRSTRDLARWYYQKDKLVLVQSALSASSALQPGMVLFYGQQGGKLPPPGFNADDLFQRGKGINHMGIVIDVIRDSQERVVEYTLFHGYGRKGKTTAKTTNWHKRNPTRSNYPPFGNGTERWVAYAPIFRSMPVGQQ